MFGLTLDDLDGQIVAIFPDNLPAANAFLALGTQWLSGSVGPTGLNYSAVPVVFRLQGLPRSAWPDTFECIRVMEGEALRVMHESEK